jgi:FkbM family methyltransferase
MDTQGIFFKDFENAYVPNILKEIYLDKIYEPYFTDKSDLTVIDCGANIGCFTFFAYSHAKRVFAIEPSEMHFDTLNTMLNYNLMTDKVTPINKAIWHKCGKETFYHNANTTINSLKKEVFIGTDVKETVETIDMGTLFDQYKIDHVDFMKLDVEGAEPEIIGSEGFARVADKIDAMVIELHSWSNSSPNLIVTTLKDLGYKVRSIPHPQVTLIGAER